MELLFSVLCPTSHLQFLFESKTIAGNAMLKIKHGIDKRIVNNYNIK